MRNKKNDYSNRSTEISFTTNGKLSGSRGPACCKIIIIEINLNLSTNYSQLKIHLANYLTIEMNLLMLHHKQVHNSQLLDRKQRLNFENVLVQPYPKSTRNDLFIFFVVLFNTSSSSTDLHCDETIINLYFFC